MSVERFCTGRCEWLKRLRARVRGVGSGVYCVSPNQPYSGVRPGNPAVFFSDNDRKYYSLERAKEVLGYEPRDNSAEWDGEEKIE